MRITRRGQPVAEVIPATSFDRKGKRKFLGDMLGTAEIVGDIVALVIEPAHAEAQYS